jgi:hypothetical protein
VHDRCMSKGRPQIIQVYSKVTNNLYRESHAKKPQSFILTREYPIPSDLGSEARSGAASSTVGDHVRSPRDDRFMFFSNNVALQHEKGYLRNGLTSSRLFCPPF